MAYLIMKPSFGVAFTSIIVSQPWLALGGGGGVLEGLVLNALSFKGKTNVSKNCGTGKKNILCSPGKDYPKILRGTIPLEPIYCPYISK